MKNGRKKCTVVNNEETGIWEEKTKNEMLRYLLVVYFQNCEDMAFVKKVYERLQCRAYHSTFLTNQNENEHLMVFKNCVLNLITRECLPFSPDYYALGRADYDYVKDAKCEKFLAYLDSIFQNAPDGEQLIKLLQEAVGLSLTKITYFQKMFFLLGEGGNGKNVFAEILSTLIGEHQVSYLPLSDLNAKFALANLDNKLVNIDSDAGIHSLQKTQSKFKAVVGGDKISVDKKFERYFTLFPHCKLWVLTNHMPKVDNDSNGLYRRITIIPFNRIFEEHEQDKNLVHSLKSEISGILLWSLEGLDRLLKNGNFTVAPSSTEALKAYKLQNNSNNSKHKSKPIYIKLEQIASEQDNPLNDFVMNKLKGGNYTVTKFHV